MSDDKQPNGWNEWSRHVLSELKRLNDCYINMNDDIKQVSIDMNNEIKQVSVEIAKLKVKSGMWGAIGGCIPLLAMLILYIIKSGATQ